MSTQKKLQSERRQRQNMDTQKTRKWDVQKYRKRIGSYLGKIPKEYNGVRLRNRTDVYDYLSYYTEHKLPPEQFISAGAFQSWAKSKSPGPNPASLALLEEHWGPLTIETTIEKNNTEVDIMNTNKHFNPFVSERIYNIVKFIKAFIHSEEVADEDAFHEMCHAVEIESLCIPERFELMFDAFIEEKLEPVIYEYDTLFGKDPSFDNLMNYFIDIELDFNQIVYEQIRPLLIQ